MSNKPKDILNKSISKTNIKNFILTLILILFICALVYSPEKFIKITLNGVLVWATIVLPALFPFMIFTKLLTSTGYIENFSKGLSGITKKLYRVPGISSYVFFVSILSGYPLGAKITADLYDEGLITREEAHRICSFTSNSGPMFIVGSVGVGMLISETAGYIILISHILAAVINGLIYRKYKSKVIKEITSPKLIKSSKKEADIITKSMENSITSILLIGGFITIFFVIMEIFSSLQVFYPITKLFSLLGVEESVTNGVLFGFFEITKGCLTIASSSISLSLKTILCSFIVSFSGISVFFQSFAFLNKFKISKAFFFLQKTTHAVLSVIIALILILIF
ncbi:MAG: hypothetical protein PHS54_02825 [Clostridia bacterium]|nr:hypothetical protein [Clostridia bacterium]